MKKVILSFIMALAFIGCSSKGTANENIEPQLVVGKSLSTLSLNDQFEKQHTLDDATTKVVFALSKDMAHICNDYFVTKEDNYLEQYNTQFVADVSAAPSIIRSMFIMPGLKDFKHTVLILDDEDVAAPYRKSVDTQSIVVVYVQNKTITAIKTVKTQAELIKLIEN